jgi:hypothetical protein
LKYLDIFIGLLGGILNTGNGGSELAVMTGIGSITGCFA